MRQVLSVAALVLATACTSSTTATPRTTPTPQAGETAVPAPSHPTLWLCQPSTPSDPCHAPLTATAVHADGSTTAVPAPARRQHVDCFYVYPTVSSSPTENAPLRVTPDETSTAKAQVAAFSSVCRVWAPIYRQLTVHALVTGGFGDSKARALARADVLDAWHDYLRLNPGRRFVLVGHSQGSFELLALLRQEIDGHPALRERLVSALLLGGNVKVPPGKLVGGDLQNVPLCSRQQEQGCVVTYNSFGSSPPANALFGRRTSHARSSRARTAVRCCSDRGTRFSAAGRRATTSCRGTPPSSPRTASSSRSLSWTAWRSRPGRCRRARWSRSHRCRHACTERWRLTTSTCSASWPAELAQDQRKRRG